MNKKGELLVFSLFILVVLIGGIFVYQGKIQDKNYVGEKTSAIVYSLKSTNSNCSLEKIQIEASNVKFFNSLEEARLEGFILNNNCN